jgi:hypothetical protein
MHPSKLPSVRHVLIFDLTLFTKLEIAHSAGNCRILTELKKRIFWYQITIFHQRDDRVLPKVYEGITKQIAGPLVENPWPRLCTKGLIWDPACNISTELPNDDLGSFYPYITDKMCPGLTGFQCGMLASTVVALMKWFKSRSVDRVSWRDSNDLPQSFQASTFPGRLML